LNECHRTAPTLYLNSGGFPLIYLTHTSLSPPVSLTLRHYNEFNALIVSLRIPELLSFSSFTPSTSQNGMLHNLQAQGPTHMVRAAFSCRILNDSETSFRSCQMGLRQFPQTSQKP